MKKLQKIDPFIITLVCAGLSAIALRAYALLTSFNNITMHFDDKTAIGIGSGVVILAIIAFLSYLFIGEKEVDLIAKNDNAASYIPAGMVCISLLFMAVEKLIFSIGGYAAKELRILMIVSAALALLSVISFFVSIFVEKKESLFKAAFSLSIVFFLDIYAAYLFYNTTVHPTNSPNKTVDQMAYIFAAVFFLFETRIPLGRAMWKPYVSLGLIATLLTAYSSIPSILVYIINGYQVSDSIIESVLTLALSVFIFSRVYQTKSLTPNQECEAVSSILAMSKMRDEELESQRKDSRARINNKEENDDAEDATNYTFDIPFEENESAENGEDIDITNSQSE